MIEHLQAIFQPDDYVAVAYVYCSRRRENLSCSDFIFSLTRQIIQQIIQKHQEMPEIARSEYLKHAKGLYGTSRMSLSTCLWLLSTLMRKLRRTYLVIDALDEYDTRNNGSETRTTCDFLEKLGQVVSECDPKCRLFLTSRTGCLDQSKRFHHSRIPIRARPDDLKMYIRARIQAQDRFSHANILRERPELRELIVNKLLQKAEGQ